jgi:hypothetical protein
MFETSETTREKRQTRARRIRMPGKGEVYDTTDPIEIARELRAKSRLGKREARLGAAARKAGNGR